MTGPTTPPDRTFGLGFSAMVLTGVAAGLLAAGGLALGPATLARAVLPEATVAAQPDPMLAAAESGELAEHIRLARHMPGTATLDGRRVRVGDRITISGRDGSSQIYAVSKIRNIAVPVRDVVSYDGAEPRLLLVICRNVSDPSGKPLRFVVEAGDDPAVPAIHHHQQQAL